MNIARALYEPFFHLLGGNPVLLDLCGWVMILDGWYIILSGRLLIPDLTGKPKWILKYKIQPNEKVSTDKLKRAVTLVGFNLVFMNLLAFYPVHVFQRLLHHPWLYKHIHKLHHEWKAPIGFVAVYTHPIEYLFVNGPVLFLGPTLMQSHLFMTWCWYLMAITSSIRSHSGYHLPFIDSPQAHDFHHLKFTSNFGFTPYLDRLHDTDKSFRNSIQYQRHRRLYGLTPIHDLFPNKQNKVD